MGRINFVKMFILLKAIYRFNVIHIKIPITFFFYRNRLNNPKFAWNDKRPQIAKTVLKKNNRAEGITHYDFKLIRKL